MTLQIELDRETEARLSERAHESGLEMVAFAHQIIKSAVAPLAQPKPAPDQEQIYKLFAAFDEAGPRELPFDDQDWSREMIYGDHP
jgi:hypothetical protein